jgi:hypothetical protein
LNAASLPTLSFLSILAPRQSETTFDRNKRNAVYARSAEAVVTLVRLLTKSASIFVVALVVTLVFGVYSGEIRLVAGKR